MSVARTVEQMLTRQHVPMIVAQHEPTACCDETAQKAEISGHRIAKAVLFRHGADYLMAVVPASRVVSVPALEKTCGAELRFASEDEIAEQLPDCARGALPAVGMAYGLPTYVDQSLLEQPEVYFEGGDHESLVHLSKRQFREVFEEARFGHFADKRHH